MFEKHYTAEMFKGNLKHQNLLLLPSVELIKWVLAYKKEHGLSNAKMSAGTSVPVGTLNRILSDPDADIKYETAHLLVRGIAEMEKDDDDFPTPVNNDDEHLRTRIQHLEEELRDAKTLAARNDQRNAETISYLTKQTKILRLATIVFAGALFLVLVAIICALLYDLTHTDVGFIRSMFAG